MYALSTIHDLMWIARNNHDKEQQDKLLVDLVVRLSQLEETLSEEDRAWINAILSIYTVYKE